MSKLYEKMEYYAGRTPESKAFTYRREEQYEGISYATLLEYVNSLAASLAENERLVNLVNELRQENLALRQENATLKQKILALQEVLNRHSTNSNQPPSQDSPFEPPKKEAAS